MLSAATACLLASALSAHADSDISGTEKNPVNTASGGNITIEASGGVNVKSTTPAVTINSNNWVSNLGTISNVDTAGAIGVAIDTTAGDIVAPAGTGFSNLGTINMQGSATAKTGILIGGGHTYFGSLGMTTLLASTTTGSTATTSAINSAQILMNGDGNTGLYLMQGTTVDGDMTMGGVWSSAPTGRNSAGGSMLVDLDGVLNGNFVFDNTTIAQIVGKNVRGIAVLGGIHACDSAAVTAAGRTCAANSAGSLVNLGTLTVAGVNFPDAKRINPESGSAIIIANSVDGGFLNGGPSTSNSTVATATINANGVATAPVVVIDPRLQVNAARPAITGPLILGPVPSSFDAGGAGYSFINRGTINAGPVDGQVSAAAVAINGATAVDYTCLSGTAGSCPSNGGSDPSGGLLNTGTILARAITTQQTITQTPNSGLSANVTATALSIGSYAYIPRIDVGGDFIANGVTTPGTIQAQVTGNGQGSAAGIIINSFANVPQIDVLEGGSITANVNTTTIAPTADIAPAGQPFTLISEAIADQSGSLKTINNAGTIGAANTQLTPAAGANVVSIARAVDLQSTTTGNVIINNSGYMLGDVLFGSAGDGNTLNIGNVGAGGTANSATGLADTPNKYAVVASRLVQQVSGEAPTTVANTIDFGSGIGHTLHVGGFGYVNSVIRSSVGGLDVQLDRNGVLYVANTGNVDPDTKTPDTLNVRNLSANGGTLGLTIAQNTSTTNPVVKATGNVYIDPNATIGLQFGSFVSSGTTAASTASPTPQVITLISADSPIQMDGINAQNAALSEIIPFLFESPLESGSAAPQPLSRLSNGTGQNLVLTLLPRSTGATNADGTPGLNLSGDAKAMFPYAAAALANDPSLGSAIASSLTLYKTSGVPSSGINIAASQQKAQQIFSQFTPDVSGGAREVAIMLTDQASGPVAARQRLLRSFSDVPGDLTLWGEEFAANINNKGRTDGAGTLTSYKDHGFGFSFGIDAGSPRGGWYGGALTFYTGDVSEILPHSSKTNMQWYMLSGYSAWRGKHLFLDSQFNLAYGDFVGHRTMSVADQIRDAESKRAGLMASLGANTGVMLHALGMVISPHVSLDGMVLREEGYTESGGGDGLNLDVAPYYANSLRTALGADFRYDISVWGIALSPEARLGYRYDFINTPVKLRAGFASTGGLKTAGNSFQFVGPDPDSGNAIAGLSLGASTDTWQLGVNYDWIRGNNGSTTQVGMLTLLGRI
jgi:hypothetical protein